MKTKLIRLTCFLGTLLVLATSAHAQGTAFTYQGRLNDGANPASGTYDLQFGLFDAASGGVQQSGTWTQLASTVSNGWFTVTLDFGNFFPGADRWLEIAVRTNSLGTFSPLSPRQKITPTPYAVYAGFAAGANAANSLGGFGAASFWNTDGNADTRPDLEFLGTTDDQPLEIKVNGTRALRLEPNPNAPNVIGGSAANEVTNGLYGAVIAGGGSGSYPNRVGAIFGTVVGGNGNTASGNFATAMGQFNTASGYAGTAMGYSTLAGGFGSQAGGTTAKANHNGAFVWADNNFVDFTSTAANQFLIRAANGVGINTNNPNGAALAVNGNATVADTLNATTLNTSMLITPTIGAPGSQPLELRANGQLGLRLDPNGAVADLTAPGDLYFGSQTRQMLNLFAGQLFDSSYGIGVQPGVCYFRTRGGFSGPASFAWYAGGAHSDTAFDPGSGFFVPGREQMRLDGSGQLTVFGSTGNGVYSISTSAGASAVYGENLSGSGFGVAGRTTGTGNAVYGDNANPSGWAGNFNGSVFVGGSLTVSGNVSVSGNENFGTQTRQMLNLWGTQYGIGVQANNLYFRTDNALNEAFRWYKGGVHNDASANPGGGTAMMWLTDQGLSVNGTFVSSSDRNAKENFKPVDSLAVLEKVAALPLSEWNYKQDPMTHHVGPMAQDFYAAFNVGPDDKHIATVDADGVALAAIQGLNQKVEAGSQKSEDRSRKLEDRLQEKETEITELRQTVNELKKLVQAMNLKVSGGGK